MGHTHDTHLVNEEFATALRQTQPTMEQNLNSDKSEASEFVQPQSSEPKMEVPKNETEKPEKPVPEPKKPKKKGKRKPNKPKKPKPPKKKQKACSKTKGNKKPPSKARHKKAQKAQAKKPTLKELIVMMTKLVWWIAIASMWSYRLLVELRNLTAHNPNNNPFLS